MLERPEMLGLAFCPEFPWTQPSMRGGWVLYAELWKESREPNIFPIEAKTGKAFSSAATPQEPTALLQPVEHRQDLIPGLSPEHSFYASPLEPTSAGSENVLCSGGSVYILSLGVSVALRRAKDLPCALSIYA